MGKYKPHLIIALILVVVVGFSYNPIANTIDKIREAKEIKRENEKLEKKIDSINANIDELRKDYERSKKKADSFMVLANTQKGVRDSLNKEIDKRNEFIKSVNRNLSVDELDDFWGKGSGQ